MNREEFYKKESEVQEICQQRAWKEFKEGFISTIGAIVAPKVFGEIIYNEISRHFEELSEKYDNNFSELITLAIRELEFASFEGALYITLCIEAGVMLDNSYTRELSSPEGYARYHGYANTLCEHLSAIDKPADYLDGTPFTEIPKTSDLLKAISLYYFNKAAINFTNQNFDECFFFLHEAYTAKEYCYFEELYDDFVDDAKRERSFEARYAALKKWGRDPRQKEKNFVFECWQEWQQNSGRYPSKAAFARDMLEKCENLVSYKKIEDWCREWEKAHPAS